MRTFGRPLVPVKHQTGAWQFRAQAVSQKSRKASSSKHSKKVAAASAEKKRVRRKRSLNIPTSGLTRANGWLDSGLFFTMSKEAVLTRMRIDAANTNARVRNPGVGQRLLSTNDRALDQARLDPFDGVDMIGFRVQPHIQVPAIKAEGVCFKKIKVFAIALFMMVKSRFI